MKRMKNTAAAYFSDNVSGRIRVMCLILCVSIMMAAVGCSGRKPVVDRVVSADDAYFSLHTIDFSEAADGEYADIKCVKQFRFNLAILITGASKYYIQFYDEIGKMFSQITLADAIRPEFSVIDMTDDMNGNLYVLTQSPDENTGKPVYEVFAFDSKGTLTGTPIAMPIDETISQGQMEVDYMGDIYLRYFSDGTGEQNVSVFSSNGTLQYGIAPESGRTFGNIIDIEDQMYLACYDRTNKKQKTGLYPFDNTNGKLGSPIDLTPAVGSDSGTLIRGGNEKLYWKNQSGVYSVSLKKQKTASLFLWENTNYRNGPYESDELLLVSDNTAIIYEKTDAYNPSIFSVSLLTREARNPDAGKKIITIAGLQPLFESNMLGAVEKFNINSTGYRVELYENSGYTEDGSRYDLLADDVNSEILSGNGPDIIFGDQEFFAELEKKGELLDLYSMMEADSDFHKDSIIPNILRICETDGHLYKLGTGFSLSGFIGAKSLIGDRTGWTVDEFVRLAESLPKTVTPLEGSAQSELLRLSLNANMNTYVDSASGTVSFDSEDFRKLLEYAKTYGTDDDTETYMPNRSEMIANGELAIARTGIYSPESYAEAVMEFGEPVSITGFPSQSQSTISCEMYSMIAISSESMDKEGAWGFVKSLYTEEGQNLLNMRYDIPVVTSVFEAQITSQLNYNPETGRTRFYDQLGSQQYEDVDLSEGYRNLIYGLESAGSYDSEILSIIMEEVPAYFNNQKTQDEVIYLIQNRAQAIAEERMKHGE